MNIKKLHYFSGITLSLFIGLHLFNHLIALFGANAHIQVMNVLRVIYRNPVTETFLLIVVVIQATSGIRLVSPIIKRGRKGRKKGKNTSFYDKLQIYSGLYLAFFLVAHTVATVWQGRQVLQLDTNFYYAAVVVNVSPALLFFFPYYFLAVVSVFGHIAAIHYKKTMHLSVTRAQTQAKTILTIGAIVGVLILIGLNQSYQGIEIPKEYYWFYDIWGDTLLKPFKEAEVIKLINQF